MNGFMPKTVQWFRSFLTEDPNVGIEPPWNTKMSPISTQRKGHKAICQNITNANYHTFRFIKAFAVKTTPPVIHVFPHSFSFKKVFILKIS